MDIMSQHGEQSAHIYKRLKRPKITGKDKTMKIIYLIIIITLTACDGNMLI